MPPTTDAAPAAAFEFTCENFQRPPLHNGLGIIDVPVKEVASNADLEGYGYLVNRPDEFCCENKTFEIVKWPVQGWRQLDPHTGDEAGTTEGPFKVGWKGDYYYAENTAVNTVNNKYLDGLGCSLPDNATEEEPGFGATEDHKGSAIFLWMSDYHPDGAQMFFPAGMADAAVDEAPFPFYVCLGRREHGDDIKPRDMRAFKIPAGKGVYIHAGTWHNGIYVPRAHGEKTLITRQGRVHARVSCSWAAEHKVLLKVMMQ